MPGGDDDFDADSASITLARTAGVLFNEQWMNPG
jgi:hypothetical protein